MAFVLDTYTINVKLDTRALFKQLGRVDGKIGGLDRQVDLDVNTGKIVKDIDQAGKQAGSRLSQRLNGALSSIQIPALVVAGGGLALGKKAVSGASELEESMNAISVVFGDGVKKIEQFGKTADKQVGLSQKAFNELSTQTGALLGDVGLSQDEVADKTITLAKRAADLASVFNTDVADSMSAINQALRGETEAIRRYAGDVTDATLQTHLMNKGLKTKVKDLTQAEKRLYRVELILNQTSVAENDFKNTIESVANKARVQAAQVENMSDALGSRLLPVVRSVQRVTQKLIDSFSGLTEGQQDAIVKTGLTVTAIAAVLAVASPVVRVLVAVGSAFKFLAGLKIASSLLKIGAAFKVVKMVASGLLMVARASPIGLLVTGVVFAITHLKQLSEFLQKVWQTAKKLLNIKDNTLADQISDARREAEALKKEMESTGIKKVLSYNIIGKSDAALYRDKLAEIQSLESRQVAQNNTIHQEFTINGANPGTVTREISDGVESGLVASRQP